MYIYIYIYIYMCLCIVYTHARPIFFCITNTDASIVYVSLHIFIHVCLHLTKRTPTHNYVKKEAHSHDQKSPIYTVNSDAYI